MSLPSDEYKNIVRKDRMNAAHLHITLVHLPVVLTPTATILLAFALYRRQSTVSTVALALLVASTVLCVPAFLLGEGAEEIIEHLPGVSEDLIEEHEEVADIAFWLSVGLGAGSLALLALRTRAQNLYAKGIKVALFLSVITSGALTYTAYEGGKIRHPEAYSDAPTSAEHGDKD